MESLRTQPKPKYKFSIYLMNRKTAIRCFIWKTKDDMWVGAGLNTRCFLACYIPNEGNRRELGEVHFYEGFFGAGVVSHELLHAIFDLASRSGKFISVPTPDEVNTSQSSRQCEYYCCEFERLNKSFWNRYYKYAKP